MDIPTAICEDWTILFEIIVVYWRFKGTLNERHFDICHVMSYWENAEALMSSMEIRRKKNGKKRKASIVMGDFDETMVVSVHAVVFYHIALWIVHYTQSIITQELIWSKFPFFSPDVFFSISWFSFNTTSIIFFLLDILHCCCCQVFTM